MYFQDRGLTGAATVSALGNVTWSAAYAQYGLPVAGVNAETAYTLLDVDGIEWETGTAILSEAAGTYTLTRGGAQTVSASSNGGAAVSFSVSSAHTLILVQSAEILGSVERRLFQVEADNTADNVVIPIPAGYENFTLKCSSVSSASGTDDTLRLQVSVDDEVSYEALGYAWTTYYAKATVDSNEGSTSDTGGTLAYRLAVNRLMGATVNIHSVTAPAFVISGTYLNSVVATTEIYNGTSSVLHRTLSADVTHIKLFTGSAANLATGVFNLYGMRIL